jgi:DNA-binding CsgD family transcriptional regulator/tetratricopeptide (TPR) repeat protein
VALNQRETELRLFDQIYAASDRGRGAVLLVNGPVGAGKTAMLQEMAERADKRGGLCFAVTASASERPHPYGVLDRLVASMCAAGMDDPFAGMDGRGEFFAMMDRVYAAFRGLAGNRPVVVGVDDVHFADEQSLRCLSYLARRIERSGASMILNESSSHERELAGLHAEILHLPYCHRVRLAPLTPADIAELLTDRLGTVPCPEIVRFCAEASGGNPLLLQALIHDLSAGAAEPAVPEPGANFRQAVQRSLHRCSPAAAAVAQSLAVLGDHAAPPLIAEFIGVDLALVRESLRELYEMGVLADAGFRHEHTRSATLAGIPVADLPEMYSHAAELLHESGAPAMAVAEQLIAAQDCDKAAWRVAILREAAREAMAVGDADSAVKCLRHAITLSSDEAQRAQVGVLVAEAQWHVDPSRAVRRLHELGQDARAGLLAGRDALVLVNQLLWWGEFAAADDLLRVADDAGKGDDDSSLARLWAIFSRTGGTPDDPAGGTRRPADSLLAHSGPMAAVTYLSSAASLSYEGLNADRADQMLRGIRAGTPLAPALYALVLLVQTGQLDEAIRWSDRLLEENWIARVPMRRVMIETIKSLAVLRGGDGATALRCIRDVLDRVQPSAWGVVVGVPLSIAVRATIDLGDSQTARSYLNVAVPAAMFDTPFALPYLQAVGRYHLAMGHPQVALAHFQSGVDLMVRWQVDAAAFAAAIQWRNEAAAALTALGMIRPMRALADKPVSTIEKQRPRATGKPARADVSPPRGTADDPAVEDGARLTDAEQRVAALAAAGNTNRQIAESLFITVSTVEQHLTKIYRKLNVHSRSGLADGMRRYRR